MMKTTLTSDKIEVEDWKLRLSSVLHSNVMSCTNTIHTHTHTHTYMYTYSLTHTNKYCGGLNVLGPGSSTISLLE